jgi:signal transduction histidine kinase
MSRLRRLPAHFAPLLVIIAFATFLAFSLVRLFQVEQDMRENVDENMLWVITQAQVASHRLDEAVNRLARGDETANPGLRFDNFVSRLELIAQGPQQRYLADLGFSDAIKEALLGMQAIEAVLEEMAPGDLTLADQVHDELAPLLLKFNHMANAVMIEEWEATGLRLDKHRESLLQAIASIVGILLSGVVMVGLLLRTLSQNTAAKRALANHRVELERQIEHRTSDLEAERARLAAAIETAPDGFAAFDTEGKLTLTNPQLAELLPYAAGPIHDQPLAAVLDTIRSQAGMDTAREATTAGTQGSSLQCDMEIPGQGWRQLTLRPTWDGGHVLRVADVTRYKQAALSLEEALQREQGVSDFYRSFAATVSHQFRTPLAVIDSGLQRLQRRGDNMPHEERHQRYERLRDAVAHMTRLVESALTVARIDGNQVSHRPDHFDLVAIVRHTCQLQEEAMGSQRIFLQPDAPSSLRVRCDRALVEQILANLLSNALKYSPPDSPVTVQLASQDGMALCRVTDQGMGIAPDDMPHLFERFFRSRRAATAPGIGLGLNIARYLARIQRGDITVSSREGAGATFCLTLPLDNRGTLP